MIKHIISIKLKLPPPPKNKTTKPNNNYLKNSLCNQNNTEKLNIDNKYKLIYKQTIVNKL